MVQLIDVFNFKMYTFFKNPVGYTVEREQLSFGLDQVWKHPKTVNLKYIAKWLQKQSVGNTVKIQWWDTSHARHNWLMEESWKKTWIWWKEEEFSKP